MAEKLKAQQPTGFVKSIDGVASAGPQRIAQELNKLGSPREADYSRATRNARIFNRAEKGHVKYFRSTYDSVVYPEDAHEDDKTTWLGPGESMVIPLDAAIHFCGNFLAPATRDDNEALINRYGGWQLEGVPRTGLTGGPPPVNIIGPPVGLPDLLVVQVDQRGRDVGEPIAIWDRCVGDRRYNLRQRNDDESKQRDSEELESRIAEYA